MWHRGFGSLIDCGDGSGLQGCDRVRIRILLPFVGRARGSDSAGLGSTRSSARSSPTRAARVGTGSSAGAGAATVSSVGGTTESGLGGAVTVCGVGGTTLSGLGAGTVTGSPCLSGQGSTSPQTASLRFGTGGGGRGCTGGKGDGGSGGLGGDGGGFGGGEGLGEGGGGGRGGFLPHVMMGVTCGARTEKPNLRICGKWDQHPTVT